MLQKTRGVVLRSVKYGETSLVVTIFTEAYGILAFLMKGVRDSKKTPGRSAIYQPASLVDLVIYHHPEKKLHRIRECGPAYIYTQLHEDILRYSVALFSAELLLRLLPENAPLQAIFELAFEHFSLIDTVAVGTVSNMPLYFTINCSRHLGYEIKGEYHEETPYLDLVEGSFSASTPSISMLITQDDVKTLDLIQKAESYEELSALKCSSGTRNRLLKWYISYLQTHTQHMGAIKSLSVLEDVLH
jgi:DNA repair protein RecO (recombination protein O)